MLAQAADELTGGSKIKMNSVIGRRCFSTHFEGGVYGQEGKREEDSELME